MSEGRDQISCISCSSPPMENGLVLISSTKTGHTHSQEEEEDSFKKRTDMCTGKDKR